MPAALAYTGTYVSIVAQLLNEANHFRVVVFFLLSGSGSPQTLYTSTTAAAAARHYYATSSNGVRVRNNHQFPSHIGYDIEMASDLLLTKYRQGFN